MSADGWVVDPRPAPLELAAGYEAHRYGTDRDPFLVPVLEKLNAADRDKLVALMGGWPIVPSDD